jgi:hypothetical protein
MLWWYSIAVGIYCSSWLEQGGGGAGVGGVCVWAVVLISHRV